VAGWGSAPTLVQTYSCGRFLPWPGWKVDGPTHSPRGFTYFSRDSTVALTILGVRGLPGIVRFDVLPFGAKAPCQHSYLLPEERDQPGVVDLCSLEASASLVVELKLPRW